MSGFQFLHISTYARQKPKKAAKGKDQKWTVRDIAGEVERDPQHSPHVQQPHAPTLVFGIGAKAAVAVAEQRAEASTDVSGRKVRADTPVMLAGVASYPHTVEELKASPDLQAEYKEWQQDVLKFLQKKYGKHLLSVVEHTDEPHPHLHFYAVPEAGKGFNAKSLHDGFAAGSAAKKDPKQQRELYNTAMRGLQDAYHAEVGVKHGQARLGPRRRRLTRAEWVRDQLIMTNAAKALREVQSRAERVLGKAKKQAASIVNEAREQAEKGGLKIGAFIDGLRGNAKSMIERLQRERDDERKKRERVEEERAKVARELVHERMVKDETLERMVDLKTKPLRSELSAEQKKRQELEKQLDSLSSENQSLKQQLGPRGPQVKR